MKYIHRYNIIHGHSTSLSAILASSCHYLRLVFPIQAILFSVLREKQPLFSTQTECLNEEQCKVDFELDPAVEGWKVVEGQGRIH